MKGILAKEPEARSKEPESSNWRFHVWRFRHPLLRRYASTIETVVAAKNEGGAFCLLASGS
jgi:hypothetical protein